MGCPFTKQKPASLSCNPRFKNLPAFENTDFKLEQNNCFQHFLDYILMSVVNIDRVEREWSFN